MRNISVYLTIVFYLFQINAFGNLDSLKQALASETVDSLKYKTLSEIVKIYEKEDRSQVTGYAIMMYNVASELKDEKKQGDATRVIGRNYLFQSNNDSSMYFLQLSNEYYALLGDSAMINKNLGNIALIYQRNNDYEKATKTYLEVINYSKKIGDYYSASTALINLASIYIDQESYEIAIESLSEVIELYNSVPEEDESQRSSINQLFAPVYINLGQCYSELDDKDKALEYYTEALNASEQANSNFSKVYYASYANHSIGYMYTKKAKEEEEGSNNYIRFWDNARFYYQNALDGFRSIKNPRGEVFSMVSLGEALARTNRINSADEILKEGLKKAQESNFREEIRDAYQHLSYTARINGDFKSSIDYQDQYILYKDSIRNEERDAVIEDIKGKYEADKKESEISRLEAETRFKSRQQTIQLAAFLFSLLGLIGLSYIFYTRYRLKKQMEVAAFEKNLSKAMSRFVPKEFINALGHSKFTDVVLGDCIEREVTILFTDIRNFTSISEELSPEKNFTLIKDYAQKMGVIIRNNNGFINQYLGDGIMAIFQDSPDDALKASIEMQKAIQDFNKNQNIIKHEVNVGMGLHTGKIVMGIIGDEERYDAALISDTVNTASRMEGAAKFLNSKIILSQETNKKLNDREKFDIRFVGDFKLKGKALPIYIYECYTADNVMQKELKDQTSPAFVEATENFIMKDFKKAVKKYKKVLKENPDDTIGNYYYQRAKDIIANNIEGEHSMQDIPTNKRKNL